MAILNKKSQVSIGSPRKSSGDLAMIVVKFGKLGGGDVAVAVVIEGAEHLEQIRLVHEVRLRGEHGHDGHRQLFELHLALRVYVVSGQVLGAELDGASPMESGWSVGGIRVTTRGGVEAVARGWVDGGDGR
jgi:hypothetical protein